MTRARRSWGVLAVLVAVAFSIPPACAPRPPPAETPAASVVVPDAALPPDASVAPVVDNEATPRTRAGAAQAPVAMDAQVRDEADGGVAVGAATPADAAPPKVNVPPPTVGPSYPPVLVRRVLRVHAKDFQRCFLKRLQQDPQATGKVLVAFTIAADGKVQHARVISSSMPNAELEKCMLSVLRGLSFPQPPNGVPLQIRFPLVLAH